MAEATALSLGASRTVGNVLTLTGSVQNLPDMAAYKLSSVALQSPSSNSGVVDIVDTAQGNIIWKMAVGSSLTIDLGNTQAIRVRGTANDVIYWMGLVL